MGLIVMSGVHRAMSEIELRLVSQDKYEEWIGKCRTKISKPSDPDNSMIPLGGQFIDLEEATNRGALPSYIPIYLDESAKFNDILPQVKASLRRGIAQLPWTSRIPFLIAAGFRTFLPFPLLEFSAPSSPNLESNRQRSLKDLGFQNGDLVIVGTPQLPLALAGGLPDQIKSPRITFRQLDTFLATLVTQPSKALDKTNVQCLGSLLLYTEEDWELATYIRQYYAYLHAMSSYYLTIWIFEHLPAISSHSRGDVRRFWAERLPPQWNTIWSALGLTHTKPYPKEQIYSIATELGIPIERIPCFVLFREWKQVKTSRIIVGISGPPRHFFRQICTDIIHGIDKIKGDRALDEFLESFSFDDLTDNLPEWWQAVTWTTSMLQKPKESTTQKNARLPTIFLCHSSVDKEFVERLGRDLRQLGLGVWLDKWRMDVGDSIVEKIEQGVGNSDYLGLVLSPAAVESPWVRKELDAAFMRELEERRVIVLPILHRPCKIPTLLRPKLYADFSVSYNRGLRSIVQRLAPDVADQLWKDEGSSISTN
jgi:hypothetical protein